jgi:saccharopine dehydrogenase-like NADP-dependent oxidoreductase
MKVIILGAGQIGIPMALDLAEDANFEVTIVDKNHDALARLKNTPAVKTLYQDLSYPNIVYETVQNHDLVINAVPGFMGFHTLESLLQARKNVVDITFFAEDPFLLDDLAKSQGVTAIVDCGVAPGMSNIITGYVHHFLDNTLQVKIYVGGLPQAREWPYQYKASFSPFDVIEEYTRPAKFRLNGKLVTRPALSDREYIDFSDVGTLEAFNSDGLRTLLTTLEIPDMVEKTLRYPGHAELMSILRETGFFGKEPLDIQDRRIRPLDITSLLLFPRWKMKDDDRDLTVMRILIEGTKGGKKLQYRYDLCDRYDEKTRVHSMARTTGYTATTAVRMLQRGDFNQQGIISPEVLGRHPKIAQFFLTELKKKGILYHKTVTEIN